MDNRFSIILGECLEGLENGSLTVEGCLQRYPEYRHELVDLLATAQTVREVSRIEPRSSFRRSARARLLAKLPNNQFVTIFEPIRLLIQNKPTYFSRRFVMTWIAIAVLLASLFGGGVAVQASADALPGQALYPLKTSLEEARLALTGDEARIDLYLDFADHRLMEAEKLLAKGAYEQIPPLFGRFWDSAVKVAGKVSYTPHAADTAAAARSERFSAQIETFTSLFGTLPIAQQKLVWLTLDEGTDPLPGEGEVIDPLPGEGEEVEQPVEGEDPFPAPTCMTHMIHPVGMKLALQYDTPYEEIMSWFCQGFGFGQIIHALQTSQVTELSPEELLLLKVELGSWGEVWKALNLIEPEDGDMAEEEEQEGEDQKDEEETAERCPTDNIEAHPAGMKLSAQFNVEYEAVMTWFCQGYGFGEIMLALQTSQIYEELTPEELLAMKTETGGWGKVWQELGLIGNGRKNQPVENDESEGEEAEHNTGPEQKEPPADNGKPDDQPGGPPPGRGKPEDAPRDDGPPADKGRPTTIPGGPPNNPGRKP